jgi:hypothetical protein
MARPIWSGGQSGRWKTRFSLTGAKSYLYSYDGYLGGYQKLDRITKLLKKNGIECHSSGSDSPLNVADYKDRYDFEDGRL